MKRCNISLAQTCILPLGHDGPCLTPRQRDHAAEVERLMEALDYAVHIINYNSGFEGDEAWTVESVFEACANEQCTEATLSEYLDAVTNGEEDGAP